MTTTKTTEMNIPAMTNKKMNAVKKAAIQPSAIVEPAVSDKGLADVMKQYKNMQTELDKAMPDAIMTIAGRQFRKKAYWRAIKTGFNLRVYCISEKQITIKNDWGFEVIYRAKAPNGAYADGDGACMANEKSRGRMQATVHNVRSHAHTRGFNRAVSNLVGFGEVSAEELADEHHENSVSRAQTQKLMRYPSDTKKSVSRGSTGANKPSRKQKNYLWALAGEAFPTKDEDELKETLENICQERFNCKISEISGFNISKLIKEFKEIKPEELEEPQPSNEAFEEEYNRQMEAEYE